MEESLLKRLRSQGLFVTLPDGRTGVPVTLQLPGPCTKRDRKQRGAWLREKFEELAGLGDMRGAEIDLSTISISAQTVEGRLPLEQVDEFCSRLREKNIRVDIIVDTQVLQ